MNDLDIFANCPFAGQDIHAHDSDPARVVAELATWLRAQPGGIRVGGAQAFIEEYETFERILPGICAGQRLHVEELTFFDYVDLVTQYVASLTKPEREQAPAGPDT